MKYYSPAEAREMDGLRLVLSAHVPGPWGEAAKGLFYVRNIPFTPVEQVPGEANEELEAWTGVRNAPVAVYNDEKPLTSWLDILMLAQRLGSGPSLLPEDPGQRALSVGLSHEICGEWGFGWCRRLMIFADLWGEPSQQEALPPVQRRLGGQYSFNADNLAAAPARILAILTMLDRQLANQDQAGSPYLVGDSLTAVDIHWATFSAMLSPLPHEVNPMPDYLRGAYANLGDVVSQAPRDRLLAHRDYIYRNHLKLPLEF